MSIQKAIYFAKTGKKRISVAVFLYVIFGLTWLRLGFEPSTLEGVVFGFIAHFMAYTLLLSAEERKRKFWNILDYLLVNRGTAIRAGVGIITILFFYGTYQRPSDPLVLNIQNLVAGFGFSVLLLYPIFRYLLRIALDNDPFSVDFYPFLTDFFIPDFILSFAYYSLTLWAIGKFGDDVNTWVVAHPDDSVAIVIAAVLVSFLMKISFSAPRYAGYIPRGDSGGAGGTIIAARPKATERDNRYTAAHEAGHALSIRELLKTQ
jgi:hypothetical protein